MPHHDEFGSSLESMFPNLDEGADMPALELFGDFGGGPTFRQAPAPFTETHLVTVFHCYECQSCYSHYPIGSTYAIRRLHHSRNSCIEYQSILPDLYGFFDHLPKAFKNYTQSVPFCLACAEKEGFLDLNAEDI